MSVCIYIHVSLVLSYIKDIVSVYSYSKVSECYNILVIFIVSSMMHFIYFWL